MARKNRRNQGRHVGGHATPTIARRPKPARPSPNPPRALIMPQYCACRGAQGAHLNRSAAGRPISGGPRAARSSSTTARRQSFRHASGCDGSAGVHSDASRTRLRERGKGVEGRRGWVAALQRSGGGAPCALSLSPLLPSQVLPQRAAQSGGVRGAPPVSTPPHTRRPRRPRPQCRSRSRQQSGGVRGWQRNQEAGKESARGARTPGHRRAP